MQVYAAQLLTPEPCHGCHAVIPAGVWMVRRYDGEKFCTHPCAAAHTERVPSAGQIV